jgi:hypothetical protein
MKVGRKFLSSVFGAAGRIVPLFAFLVGCTLQAADPLLYQTARISSIGGAVTASAEDLSEISANCSALASMDRAQLIVDRADLYQTGMVNSFFAGFYPFFETGGIQLSWIRLAAGQALGFDDTEDVIAIGLSRLLFGIKSGISLQYTVLNSVYGNESFNKSVLDFGLGLQKELSFLNIGLNARNIISGVTDPVLLELQAGAAVKPWPFLVFEADYGYRQGLHGFNLGLRIKPRDEFDVSCGWYYGSFFAAGLSFNIRGFAVDYSVRIPQHADLLLTHDIALRFTFWK